MRITGFGAAFLRIARTKAIIFVMGGKEIGVVAIRFTRAEALEIFSRCLQSLQEDSEASSSALRKIAEALESAPQLREAA